MIGYNKNLPREDSATKIIIYELDDYKKYC